MQVNLSGTDLVSLLGPWAVPLVVVLSIVWVAGKSLPPIITAIGNALNERRSRDQAHQQAVLRLMMLRDLSDAGTPVVKEPGKTFPKQPRNGQGESG